MTDKNKNGDGKIYKIEERRHFSKSCIYRGRRRRGKGKGRRED